MSDNNQNDDTTLKGGTQNQAEGIFHETKGKVKEAIGHAIGNPNLEAEGQDDQVAGFIQKKIGQIEKVFDK